MRDLMVILLLFIHVSGGYAVVDRDIFFDDTDITVTAFVGTTAVLPCTAGIQGTNYRLVWVYESHTVVAFKTRRMIDDSRFSVESSIPNQWNLNIQNVRADDEGIYTCMINTYPRRNKKVQLLITQPRNGQSKSSVRDIKIGGTTEVYEFGTITIWCNGTNYDVPEEMDWFKDGLKITSNDHYSIRTMSSSTIAKWKISSVLEIKDARKNDSGSYVCRSSDSKVVALAINIHTATTTTPVPTTITTSSTTPAQRDPFVRIVAYAGDITTLKGNAITLWCEARGYPSPVISWYNLPKDDNSAKIEIQKGGSRLRLTDVKGDREIECEVSVRGGLTTSRVMKISVHYAPKVDVQFEKVYNANGNMVNARLDCHVSGRPILYQAWLRDGQALYQDDDEDVLMTECRSGDLVQLYSLIIRDISSLVGHKWTCEAFNMHGHDSNTINL